MTSNNSKKPQRGLTEVLEGSSEAKLRAASHFRSTFGRFDTSKNGWYNEPRGMRAFRYATSNPCRVPTARYPLTATKPAVLEVSSDQRSSENGWLPFFEVSKRPEVERSDAYGII